MNHTKILSSILDIGAAMIRSGAETHRVEDSLYRLCAGYGFTGCHVWVVPSNIQATITSPDGEILTQVRHIPDPGVDFTRLEMLNDLCRHACAEQPGPETLRERLSAILDSPPQKTWVRYFAGALAGTCFGVFYNCGWTDALAALGASLLITFLSRKLSRRESNPLILNFLVSCAAEFFILGAVALGIGRHPGYITVGVVMLLISALGTTNGVRDLVHLDTLSGLVNITASFTGAVGIALGIALPLLLTGHRGGNELMTVNPDIFLRLISCTLGCAGFAIWFHVRSRNVPVCAVGAFLTWGIYFLVNILLHSDFAAVLIASAACGLYSQIMARLRKAPATVFMTASVFPLIPGGSLYSTMYGLVIRNVPYALSTGVSLVLTCFAIVLGFMAVEVLTRLIWPEHPPVRT